MFMTRLQFVCAFVVRMLWHTCKESRQNIDVNLVLSTAIFLALTDIFTICNRQFDWQVPLLVCIWKDRDCAALASKFWHVFQMQAWLND